MWPDLDGNRLSGSRRAACGTCSLSHVAPMTRTSTKKHAMISRLLLCGIVVAVATAVMMPRLASPRFGLLDDGVVILGSESLLRELRAGNYASLFSLEAERGRFTPLISLYYAIQYAIWRQTPAAFFAIQWLTLIATAITISGIALVGTGDRLAAILSGVAYTVSGPAVESYYTLSKSEPPMVLWLALSLLCLLAAISARDAARTRGRMLFAASVALLLAAYFTKETALAMVLVSGMWACSALWRERRCSSHSASRVMIAYFLASLAIALTFLVARTASGTAAVEVGGDSRGYLFAAEAMSASLTRYVAWYVRDFPYLLPILACMALILVRSREVRFRALGLMTHCALWVVGWTVIMLPWHSALEYYLLPASVGTAVMTGLGSSVVAGYVRNGARPMKLFALIACVATLCLALLVLVNGCTNGRVQIAVDSSNAELVDYLALNVPAGGTVLVNLPWFNEYVVELGLHLSLLKQRGDMQVGYAEGVDMSSQSDVFVVTPIMRNQPFPLVRIPLWDGGARALKTELQRNLGEQATPVWHTVHEVRLLTVWVERPVCLALLRLGADGTDGTWCGVARPLIDRRLFEYGWEVYVI